MAGEVQVGFSIVVCSHNGMDKLHPTMAHIAHLGIPVGYEIEVIIVDNASTDGTGLFVKEVWSKFNSPFPLIVLEEKRPGKGYAIETGYDAAKYSYILTADDDNWLAPDYLIKAAELFESNAAISVLQGRSIAEYETVPPAWLHGYEYFFVIGSPISKSGFFPDHNFFVWGAGMIIKKSDWSYLRNLGFSCLTSKLPGKAAGEDNETVIGLLMLGRKIYYSDQLQYKHYMPQGRLKWETLMKNFETFGYISYYFFLYASFLDAYYNDYNFTKTRFKSTFRRTWFRRMRSFTWKQHLSYWLRPRQEYYQLRLAHYYSLYKWYSKLNPNVMQDAAVLQNWMVPLLKDNPQKFKMPVAV